MRSNVLRAARILSGLGILAAAASVAPLAQPRETVAIDKDDIGGVVSGPKGPEAGVWVIAETRDLGVRYIKSVVTDDRGRYVVPDLPAAKYQVWARGYGLVDSAKAAASPGTATQHHGGARAQRRGGGEVLPRDLLVLDAEDPRRRGVRRQGPRHCSAADRAAPMDRGDEEHRLHRLSSAGPGVHAHDPAVARHLRQWRRRLEAARAVGPVRRDDARPADQPRRTGLRQLRRVDRPRRQRRPAVRQAVAPRGGRAQHRRDPPRLDGRETLPPRPHLERSPASHGECERPAVRLAGVQLRPAADSRPDQERGHHVQGAGSRSADAAEPRAGARRRPRSDDAVALLGQRADLGDPRQQPQLDVRQGRPVVAGGVGARRRQPGVVQGRLLPSVGQGVPDGPRRPSSRGPQPKDDEVRLRRDLLLDAPSAVRLRRQRHALDEWRWSGGGVARHEEVRRHRRRRGVAGLDSSDPRYQRQRQTRRVRRARPAARFQPRTSASTRRSMP